MNNTKSSFIKSLFSLYSTWINAKKLPASDENATLFRLAANGLPYLIFGNGYSLKPLSVYISLNTRCNMKCKMCDVGQDLSNSTLYKNFSGAKREEIPEDELYSIIDQLAKFKPYISFPSVEPLRYKALPKVISYVKEKNMNVGIATNGLLLKKRAEELVAARLDKIQISLDGPPEIHNRIRGVRDAFRVTLDGINKLIEIKEKYKSATPKIFINFVSMPLNCGLMTEFLKYLPLQGIEQVDFRVLHFVSELAAKAHNARWNKDYPVTSSCLYGGINVASMDIPKMLLDIEDVKKMCGSKCHFFYETTEEYLTCYYHTPELFLNDKPCVQYWFTAQINQDAEMLGPPTCYNLRFGNVVKEGFENVWNGKKIRAWRKAVQKEKRFPACTRCHRLN